MKRCDICVTEECGGKYNCNCEECKDRDKCPKSLHPTIRITNKCTQKCNHCAFESSPGSKIMMTLDTAMEIAKFLESNEITYANVMGGEFFCNPEWYEILDCFLRVLRRMRLVTNGDWVENIEVKNKIKSLIEEYKDKLFIGVSKDKWHTNKNVEKTKEFLSGINANYNIATPEETTDESIVPIGRGQLHYTKYSLFYTYCSNPINNYSFLIDEDGLIYKCGFGTWSYAKIQEYLNGGFSKQFKKFNQKFYKVFIPNCKTCRRCAENVSPEKYERVTVLTK